LLPPAPHQRRFSGRRTPADLRWFVFVLFFVFGGITSLNDVLIPKLKELFTLNYTQAMLIQFCFFTAYLVVGIPGARLVKRLGYMRGAWPGWSSCWSAACCSSRRARRRLRPVPARPVRAGERRGAGPGGRQSAHLAAGAAADGA
jgi:hypothetical protein